jgi:hypothetical protein
MDPTPALGFGHASNEGKARRLVSQLLRPSPSEGEAAREEGPFLPLL